jgi:hypothetical protein
MKLNKEFFMRKTSIGLLTLIGFFVAYIAYAQTTRETLEKRKIENYISVGSGDFSIDDGVVVNDSSADVDVRIESDNDPNAFFVQGSDGFLGIGTNAPDEKLEVSGEIKAQVYSTGKETISSGSATLTFNAGTETGIPTYSIAQVSFYVAVDSSNYAIAHYKIINGGSTSISYPTTVSYTNIGTPSLASATYFWSGGLSYPRVTLTATGTVDVTCVVTILGKI